MQKIMFNSYYGLQSSVLKGTKTMTRRPVGKRMTEWDIEAYLKGHKEVAYNLAQYKIGEIVAIAQRYKDCGYEPNMLQRTFVPKPTIFPELDPYQPLQGWIDLPLKYHKGWNNKMFVLADLMPLKIQITDIKVERLQDISDEDVYKEGFRKEAINNGWGNAAWHWEAVLTYMDGLGRYKQIRSENPKEAFSCLIDKLSGLGTWDRNDWQFAYSFKLVK